MDLITLDDNNQPYQLVENYDSLIWTERYTVGDFQITTGDVDRFMEVLPEGQVVSLRESTVPMVVERHLIKREKNKPTILTIKGRECTSYLERRQAVKAVAAGSGEWSVVAKIPSDAAHYTMYQVCEVGIASADDIFPASEVVLITPDDYLTGTGPNKSFAIPRGNLLKVVLDFLQAEAPFDASTTPDTPAVVPHGIRAIRPDSSGTAIGIEIYVGTDKSNLVYFDGTRNLLNDGSYLFSKEGSANTAYVIGSSNAAVINPVAGAVTGLERRVLLVDGTNSGISDIDTLIEHGKISLSEAKPIAMFDGSINEDITPYIYGVDYGLGDIVKLVGDYGLDERARVTEYIRSEDATGSKSYPTLVTVQD